MHALLDSFENVFDSSWKFKAVKIISSDELLNNKSLKVEHIDYNAEVHSILPIMNCKLIKASDGDSEHEFIISLQVVQDILNLIPSDEEIVEITYNNQSAESQIGLGINIKTSILSSIGASKNAKRAASIHLFFNLIGTIVFLIVFYALNHFIAIFLSVFLLD